MSKITPYYELDTDDPFYAPKDQDPNSPARLCAFKISVNSGNRTRKKSNISTLVTSNCNKSIWSWLSVIWSRKGKSV